MPYYDQPTFANGALMTMVRNLSSCFSSNAGVNIMVASQITVIQSGKEKIFEPRHDKTNKVSVRPAKTQISLGIRPV